MKSHDFRSDCHFDHEVMNPVSKLPEYFDSQVHLVFQDDSGPTPKRTSPQVWGARRSTKFLKERYSAWRLACHNCEARTDLDPIDEESVNLDPFIWHSYNMMPQPEISAVVVQEGDKPGFRTLMRGPGVTWRSVWPRYALGWHYPPQEERFSTARAKQENLRIRRAMADLEAALSNLTMMIQNEEAALDTIDRAVEFMDDLTDLLLQDFGDAP